MKTIVLALACLFISATAVAQTEDKPWALGFQGGLIQYQGDLGDGFYKTDQASYGFGGLVISRYLSNHVDLALTFSKGDLGFIDRTTISTTERANNFLVRHDITNLMARFYLTKSTAYFRPYVVVGGGLIWYEAMNTLRKDHFVFSLPTVGAGLHFRLGPVVSLKLQESLMFTTADHIDNVTAGGSNDMELLHTVALTFNLGSRKDTDHDGVSDKKDKCENTPSGISVDETGCPLDKDKDGIADYLDACPDIAGLAGMKGCPDRDMDGITDAADRCPSVFGTAALKGCPDADQDGIADIDDNCAGTPKGYVVDGKGCPVDTDSDGIVNEEDKCPEKAGILAFKGCPDTDGDGIADNDDRCPTLKGSAVNKGCPEIAKLDIQRITLLAGKIYFETNKADLKLISYSALDDLVEILKRNEAVNLTIGGHTDSDADDNYNLTLSQKRTESVKDYLISKGIDSNRITAIGYGESKPIAPNTSKEGKAKNRRVELSTSY